MIKGLVRFGTFFDLIPELFQERRRRCSLEGSEAEQLPLRPLSGSLGVTLALLYLATGLNSSVPAVGQGFELVIDLAPGSEQSDFIEDNLVGSAVLINGYTVFQGCTEAFGCEPWRSDGTALGTEMLADIDPGPRNGVGHGDFVEFGGYAYFTAGFPAQIWRTDGTPENTELFVERTGTLGQLRVADGALWFNGWDEEHGEEPWTSDGTLAGTYRVADLEPGPTDSDPRYFTAAGGLVYFSAEASATGRELYATDGTEVGTFQVADIRAGTESSAPVQLNALGNLLLFKANDGTTGSELWRTDGTGVGTVRMEIRPGPEGSNPTPIGEVSGGIFLLAADDGVDGQELWRTNGTIVQQVIDLNPGASNGIATGFSHVRIGDHVYFSGISIGTNGEELFRTDGTAAGTQLIADIHVGGASSPRNFVPIGDKIYFSAWNPDDGRELWATNMAGTVTEQITNLDADDNNSLSFQVTGFPGPGGILLFPAEVDPFGFELWRTDGTAGGTQRLTDVIDPASSRPLNLTPWRGGLAFQPFEGEDVGALVTTDGTELGTNVFSFPFSQFPVGSLCVWQDDLYLSENSSVDGTRLWKWNGFAESLIAEDAVSSTLRLHSTQAGVAFSRSGVLSITDGTVVGDFSSLELASAPAGLGSDHWYGVDGAWYVVDGQLWRTDLAADTSELLVDLTGDPELTIHEVLGEVGGNFYFTLHRVVDGLLDETLVCAADDSPQGYSIVYSFDGAMGTISVSSSLFSVEGRAVLLSEVASQAWQVLTLGLPSMPADEVAEGEGQPAWPNASDRWLAFRATDGLWRTDGTSVGTALVGDTPGQTLLKVFDRWALLSGLQIGRGLELSLVDLTWGGQVLLPEVQPGPVGTQVGPLVVEDDMLWMSAFRMDVGQELFRLDLSPFLTEPVFVDGFESGDTSAWSITTP